MGNFLEYYNDLVQSDYFETIAVRVNDFPCTITLHAYLDLLRWTRIRWEHSLQNADNLKKIVENDSLSSLNIGAAIKTVLIESAARCKIKRRKQPKDSDQKTTPWFDGTCERAKNDVRKLGNELKKDPENTELRNNLGIEKKETKETSNDEKKEI